MRRDAERADVLLMKDQSILKKHEWARYREPGGVPYKRLAEALA